MSTAIAKPNRRQMTRVFRPFEMMRREFDDLFGRMTTGWDWDGNWFTWEFKAPCDIVEMPDAFELHMDVPGIKPEDINIEVTGEVVCISGERKEEKEGKDKTFHRMERRSGKFCERVMLPSAVKNEKVEAEFHDGVLSVRLPKIEASKTRAVQVKVIGK